MIKTVGEIQQKYTENRVHGKHKGFFRVPDRARQLVVRAEATCCHNLTIAGLQNWAPELQESSPEKTTER
jgi:hypothetical protein